MANESNVVPGPAPTDSNSGQTGTYVSPAFQIGQTIAEERSGQVASVNDVWIKLSTSFRPYLAILSGNELKALVSIALRINDEYKSWPSVRTIAKECGYSKSTASRSVATLENLDIVEVVRTQKPDGSWDVNHYRIKAHFGFGKSNPKQVKGVAPVQQGVPPAGQGTVTDATRVSHLSGTELEPSELEPFKQEPLKPAAVEGSNSKKIKTLISAGIWEQTAKTCAPLFSEEQIASAIAITDQENPDNPGALLAAKLRRWAGSEADMEADIAKIGTNSENERARRRYQQGQFADFWDA